VGMAGRVVSAALRANSEGTQLSSDDGRTVCGALGS
jgi:hypothetical protein